MFLNSSIYRKLLVNIGDKHLEKSNIEQALEYYYLAQEEGKEKAKEVHLEIANQHLEEQNYDSAIRYLKNETNEYLTEKEISNVLSETLWAHLNTKELSIDDLEKMLNAINMVMPKGNKDRTELKDEIYYRIANIEYEAGNYEKMIAALKNCQENEGSEIYKNYQELESGKYSVGAQKLIDYHNDKKIALEIFKLITKNPIQNNVTKYLDYNLALNMLKEKNDNPEEEKKITNSIETYSEITIGAKKTIKTNNGKERSIGLKFEGSEIDRLKEKAGKDPQKKILIIYQSINVRGTKEGIYLVKDLMERLPEKYKPDTMESVEYIIYIEATEKLTGAEYGCGTKQTREDVTVTLYYAPWGNKTWSKYIAGPTSYVLTYFDTPPTYHSEGGPDIKNELQTALTKIEQGYR